MAGGSLLALLDDIATVLDDVAVMTKVAAKKTAGVLGDDLALNAQQVSGIRASRELPVVWAVAVGSLKNKMILVPLALLLSAFFNQAIVPLLVIGGLFLCFEGFEKVAHHYLHSAKEDALEHDHLIAAITDDDVDMVAFEKDKIKAAVRTDFILSGEIIIITLGTVASATFMKQVSVLVGISILMTVGVYGLVAMIVKLDDLGLYLKRHPATGFLQKFSHLLGNGLLAFAPRLMKSLTVIGTAAMFMVGGSIVVHGIDSAFGIHLGPMVEQWMSTPATALNLGEWAVKLLSSLSFLFDLLVGVIAGGITLVAVNVFSRLFKKKAVQA
jgi:predicted DNA repair protein MutK